MTMRKTVVVILCVLMSSCIGTGLVVTRELDPLYYSPHNRIYTPYVPYYPPQRYYYYYPLPQYYYVPVPQQKPRQPATSPPTRLNRGRD